MTLLALLDLSVAFDTMDHDILLHRLYYTYGISGMVLQWIRSFLVNCIQVISFAGQRATQSTLTCGMQQGSVSSPTFFSFCTQQMSSIYIAQSFDENVLCYADDLLLYIHCRTEDAAAT